MELGLKYGKVRLCEWEYGKSREHLACVWRQKLRQALVSDLSHWLGPLVYSCNKESLYSSFSCPLTVHLEKLWPHLALLEVLGLLSVVYCCLSPKRKSSWAAAVVSNLPDVNCRLAVIASEYCQSGAKGELLTFVITLTHSCGRRLWRKHCE